MILHQRRKERVTVIIPTKNRRVLLEKTLASLQAQTYDHWQAIVIDDGSTDNTLEFLKEKRRLDRRIRCITAEGTGAPACRNAGLGVAKGEFVIFLDSDDCLGPDCLANRTRAMTVSPDLDYAVFQCGVFRDRPGDTPYISNALTKENDMDRFLQLDPPWMTVSLIWRRDALQRLGYWDDNALSWQDWEYSLRALTLGMRYKKFREIDCYWRRASGPHIGSNSRSPAHLRSHERLLSGLGDGMARMGLLHAERRDLVAGLYFWLARRWIEHGMVHEAGRVWAQCRALQYVTQRDFEVGLIFLHMSNHRWLQRFGWILISRLWPERLLLRPSTTFRVSVPEIGSKNGTAPVTRREAVGQ